MLSRTRLFEKSFSAFLFDMDGTLINSIPATERVWSAWALSHGLDVAAFLPTMHGVRGIDTIRRLALPGVDAEAEAKEIERREIEDVDGIVPIAGAARFLASLPADRWGIVTSAPIALARRRLAAAGLPVPAVIVTAEDVEAGKPAPDGYLLGARRLGVEAADCVVFEDVPAGVRAGESAGASVAVIIATHTHPIETTHPTLDGYENVEVHVEADGRLSLLRAAA
ncbi:HAD-IA family hydrolase [Shinella daejeonensis]|uniref:HAD-IA family hydrolase n=1 Tax=Shinella daejeonensis TaxID=659017 RepID=UPI003467CC2C